MFADGSWLSDRTDEIDANSRRWLRYVAGKKPAIIECGTGTAIPTVRLKSERVARTTGGTLIRINMREPRVPIGQISIPLPAAEALGRIASAIYSPS